MAVPSRRSLLSMASVSRYLFALVVGVLVLLLGCVRGLFYCVLVSVLGLVGWCLRLVLFY